MLDQFGNDDNPLAHYRNTGPEIWEQTGGRVTHFVSSMGTTGTVMGTSRFLKEKNPNVKIVGLQPTEEASIPGNLETRYARQKVDSYRLFESPFLKNTHTHTHCLELIRHSSLAQGIPSKDF